MAPEGELALMSWAVCQGALGNIQPGELQNPNSDLSVRLRNILPAWGGQDGETVEECYRRVEREFKQPCRCVTLADFEEAVRSTPGVPVKRVRAFLRKEAPNQVFVALETYGDNHTLNPGCLDNLRRAVFSQVMVGTKVNFLPPSYVELKVYAEISLKPQQSDKRQMVHQAFSDYFEDEKIGFGAVLRKNDLLDYLYTLPCVSRVEALDLSFSGSNAVLRNGDVFLQDHCLPAVGSLNITIRTDES